MINNDFDTDILIIGGGINGVGIARDAAGRGLRVTLCEKGDLGEGTSSASTKLIHGGLRYLEHYEFGLVRSALKEREVILNLAPHIVRPMRFILPQSPGIRPIWLIRLGLFLYDHLGARKRLPGSGSLNLAGSQYGQPLQSYHQKAAYYSDCWVDDSRLVILNALDAQAHGANILTRTECVRARPDQTKGGWLATLSDSKDGTSHQLHSRIIVNAAGPWAKSCLSDVINGLTAPIMRLVRGSHIVVPKLFSHDNAYIFQNPDRRIVFAIPYEHDFTMIGTTDEDFNGDLDSVTASTQEITYLCETANRFFAQHITSDDIIWSFSGVRPLLEDGSGHAEKVTRDYRLDYQKTKDGAVALSILGGKITTYRKLAEQAVNQLSSIFNNTNKAWTSTAPLPGGNLPGENIDEFIELTAHEFPWLPHDLLCRYATSYGTRMSILLNGVSCFSDLGAELTPGLFEIEIRYLIKHEWAHTVEDILWRRTKLGILANTKNTNNLQDWLKSNAASQGANPQQFGKC